jgi:hypothetical protein
MTDQDFQAEVARRVEAFSAQVGPGGVPFFHLPGAPDGLCRCLSCGDLLAAPYPPRCRACIEAANRVVKSLSRREPR